MDKKTAKLIAAERLRREIARRKEAEQKIEDLRKAYTDGKRAGLMNTPDHVRVPPGFIEHVLREMAHQFARMAMEKATGNLPFAIVGKVAEKVWNEMNWQGASLDRMAEMHVSRTFERGDVQIDVYIPAMQASRAIDRRMLQMMGGA